MHPFRGQLSSAVALAFPPTLLLADYIINIAGFEFSTETRSEIAPLNSRSRVASGAIVSLSGR
jgi:hypothetical protein